MADRQLYRSRNALVGGVCAGIAERIDADAIVVRIFAVLLALVTLGLSIVVYVVLWVRLPLEPEGPEPLEVMPEYAESNAFGAIAYRENGTLLESRTLDKSQPQGLPIVARLAVAVGLMLLFLVVSINISPLVPGTQWWQFWPIAFMIVGLCLMIVPIKSSFEALWHALGVVITSVAAIALPVALDIAPIDSVVSAATAMWPVVALAFVLFVAGLVSKRSPVVIVAAIVFAAFCLLTLSFFALPGVSETLVVAA